jgi:NADH-quinone oxidoreductase subunit M
MTELPFTLIAIGIACVGSIWLGMIRSAPWLRQATIGAVLSILVLSCASWWQWHEAPGVTDWDHQPFSNWYDLFMVDALTAPLLPLMSLLYALVLVATPPTKASRISYAGVLFSLGVLLAAFTCRIGWGLIGLLILQAILPWWEIRNRGGRSSFYAAHMWLFAVTLVVGWALCKSNGPETIAHWAAFPLLVVAISVRCGVVPFHGWVPELTREASFSSAILFLTPMVGIYAAIRLLLPMAPDWALRTLAIVSLITAIHASGMAFIQREARNFYSYLFLSHASLVTVGLDLVTPVSLTGALCLWTSVSLSLGGFGLTLRSIEARTGRIYLTHFMGMYDQISALAALFVLTGLASIGFPGTTGFIGTELLVDGVVQVYPLVGAAVAFVAAMNSIAVIRVYFRIFTGKRPKEAMTLSCRLGERVAVGMIACLIVGGGLMPQFGIDARFRAARAIMVSRSSPSALGLEALERSQPGPYRNDGRANPNERRQDAAEHKQGGDSAGELTSLHTPSNP